MTATDEGGAVAPPGRIGPNAVIRVAEALDAEVGRARRDALFAAAGLAHYADAMPEHMIDEREVTALHAVLRAELGLAAARRVSWQAGLKTADYLLAHRIPKPAQWLLKRLPPALASRLLLKAIGGHAWTFAGSGSFRVEPGRPLRLVIAGGPIARGARVDAPVCDFYAATFERLYRELVSPRAAVEETACEARGDAACVFEVRW